VVGRVAEERYQWLSECISRAGEGVHERAADAICRWSGRTASGPSARTGCWPTCPRLPGTWPIVSPAAVTATRDSSGIQAGPAEFVDQPGLGHDLARRSPLGEGGGPDGADNVGVALGLASDQHAVTMTLPTARSPAAAASYDLFRSRCPASRHPSCSRSLLQMLRVPMPA
jgi:hypothetical protein